LRRDPPLGAAAAHRWRAGRHHRRPGRHARPGLGEDVMTRTVLITGTSSGIGLQTALVAARAGFTPVATMRDPSRSDELRKAAAEAGVEIDIRQLDVTDPDSID